MHQSVKVESARMRRLTIGLVLLATLTGCCAFAADAPAGITWLPGLDVALKAAATSGKPVLANFVSDYCEFCQDMDKEVLPTADITGLLTHFECVRIDSDKHDDLVVKYRAFTIPAYIFLDSKGEVIAQFAGYFPADVFGVKVRDALHLWQARPELDKLLAKYQAHTATPPQLARLGYLLRLNGRNTEAREVLNAARAEVELDLHLLDMAEGGADSAGKLEAWVFANPDSARRWEAQYQLGVAQSNANANAQAVGSFSAVAGGAPQTDWGILAKYHAALLGPEVNQPKTGG
jgi:thioredoxin-related protein